MSLIFWESRQLTLLFLVKAKIDAIDCTKTKIFATGTERRKILRLEIETVLNL